MPRALIIGVSGQDGAYLADLLLEKGYEVFGTSRDAALTSFANLTALGIRERVSLVSMATNDFRSVYQTLRDVEPDEIYNLAGQSSVGLSFDQPVGTFESISVAALQLLEAVRISGLNAKIYNAASGECFGETPDVPATEETALLPRSPYAAAKAAAYWHFRIYREAYGLHCCSGFLFNHESPLRHERFVTRKIIKAAVAIERGEQSTLALGDLSIRRDWGWAADYVEAMWMMLQHPQPRDFVIATGQSVTLEAFVHLAFDELGLDPDRYLRSDPALARPNELRVSTANPSLAARELGWKAKRNWEDVVRQMVGAERERGPTSV